MSQDSVVLGSVIMTLGVKSYPDVFAGAETLPSGQVIVYVVPGNETAFLEALPPVTATPVGPSYIVKRVENSWTSLHTMTRRIADDGDWHRTSNIELAQWGPDVRSNRVVISMRRYDSAQAESLVERYGNNIVAVSKESMPTLPRRLRPGFP